MTQIEHQTLNTGASTTTYVRNPHYRRRRCTQGTITYVVDGENVELVQEEALCVRRGQIH